MEELSPNITMKKVLEPQHNNASSDESSSASSNCSSDDKMINDFINDFINDDDVGVGSDGDGGDGQSSAAPEITDLFFDMKERWQSAYLDDLAKGGKCEYDDICNRRNGRNPPGRIKSFMSSVAGAVKHRGGHRRGSGEGRSRRGVSRSASENFGSKRSDSDSSGIIIDKAST